MSYTSKVKEEIISQKHKNASVFAADAFLKYGHITDPQKEYHLEFVLADKEKANEIYEKIKEQGINLKFTKRGSLNVLYLKESEGIEDILTLMGAVKSAMEIMNIKIFKDVRNKVNRVTNCETANISKTIQAASTQIRDINYLKQVDKFTDLPKELQQIANLRVSHSELSLNDLCKLTNPPVSKSGVNHRLKRISAIASELRNKGN